MKQEKQLYASPEAEVLVVQSEGVICESLKEKEMQGGWVVQP